MARDPNSREAVAERVFARSELAGTRGLGDKRLDQWRGPGDYYYEITDQGIKVTGGPSAKTLQGKSVVLGWDDRDPKNMQMVDAILTQRGGTETELGVTAPAPAAEEAPAAAEEPNLGESELTGEDLGSDEARLAYMAKGLDAEPPPEALTSESRDPMDIPIEELENKAPEELDALGFTAGRPYRDVRLGAVEKAMAAQEESPWPMNVARRRIDAGEFD